MFPGACRQQFVRWWFVWVCSRSGKSKGLCVRTSSTLIFVWKCLSRIPIGEWRRQVPQQCCSVYTCLRCFYQHCCLKQARQLCGGYERMQETEHDLFETLKTRFCFGKMEEIIIAKGKYFVRPPYCYFKKKSVQKRAFVFILLALIVLFGFLGKRPLTLFDSNALTPRPQKLSLLF